MQEDKKKYREVANLRHMFATLAIILLVLAGAQEGLERHPRRGRDQREAPGNHEKE